MTCQKKVPGTFSQQNSSKEKVNGKRCLTPFSGFTLLEVLLALGLSLILLVAVYGALDLFYRYSRIGQEEMERSQVARALLNRMAVDIRSVIYKSDQQEEDQEGNSDSVTVEEDSITVEVIDPAESYAAESVGVFGNAETLVLHISRPRLDQMYASDDGTSIGSSDLQSVSYFLAGSEGSSSLQELVALQASNDSTASPGDMTGLARMQGDRLAMNLADEQGDLESMAAQTQLLAEEVESLQFQYFDGLEWVDEWDSVAFESLPLAISITLGFRPPDESVSLLFSGAVSPSTDVYRLLVALPIAEPVEEETEALY